MRKLLLSLLMAALTLGLVACGGSDEEATTSEASNETADATTSSDAEVFTITASNWEFVADKELTIKKGTKVKLNLVNKEGVHTIANDELGIKLSADAPSEFTADTTGEYELLCSTVCGAAEDHEAMKISLKIID
jgi:cytochrome c oxidase subunit II